MEAQGAATPRVPYGEPLDEARREGLRYVELTTDANNIASQLVIEANGGVLVEEFIKATGVRQELAFRYRVDLL